MATLPQEDQDLIDRLNTTMTDLYAMEEAAARDRNEPYRRAIHRQISLIRGLIKSVIEFHVGPEEDG